MIMSYTQSNPRTRTQLNPSHANVTASLRLQQTQRSSSPSQQARIMPPQRPLQTVNRTYLDVKRPYGWTKKNMNFDTVTWTASRIFEAPRTFSHRRDSGSHSNKHNMPSSAPSCSTVLPLQLLSQPGKSSCLAVGSSWDDLLSTPQKGIAPISWKLDLISSGRKTGRRSGPWFVLNVMWSCRQYLSQDLLTNRNSLVYDVNLVAVT